MTWFVETREVRVTARSGVTTPFVAPDVAPVPLLARELEKGLKGWTDTDNKVETVTPRFTDWSAMDLEETTVGETVVRHTMPAPAMRAHRNGPRRNRGRR